ncbi:MAG: phytanoyl-CoA dioxygenase, partial [Azospira oryzae]
MTPEQVLSYPPRVLTQEQREFYFEHGYLLVERIIPEEWLQ